MDIRKESLQKHYEWLGKIEVISRAHIENRHDLSLAYTPGVAEPCLEIQKNPIQRMNLLQLSSFTISLTSMRKLQQISAE